MSSLEQPFFFQAADVLQATGKGKSAYLYENFKKLNIPYPKPLQAGEGDCFNPSSLVTMADGSKKSIIDIKVGDLVISAIGNIKKVLSVFNKPFTGKMIKITTQSYHKPLICTPDHKLVQCVSKNTTRWNRADLLDLKDYILVSKMPNINNEKIYDLSQICPKSENVGTDQIKAIRSNKLANRFIKNSEKLFWLFGMYLAEGSCDLGGDKLPKRITFNLSNDEILIAEKIKQYIKDVFNLDAIICSVPSKPSVLYVRIGSYLFANFVKHFCTGNVYSKSFSDDFKIESFSNKLALLEGWMDGDGWEDRKGVTVSENLAYNFFDIANSLGMNVRIDHRKAYKQSKKSYSVDINCSVKTYEKAKVFTKTRLSYNFITKVGKAAKIKNVEYIEPETDKVYCIEVEGDNSFICDGYGVHNCVSHATSLALDTLSVTEIVNGDREVWVARSASEYVYHVSRMVIGKGRFGSGGGSVNAYAAKGLQEYGSLRRTQYNSVDLTKYSEKRAYSWGRGSIPKDLYDIAKAQNIGKFAAIKNFSDACDSLYNGYPIVVASSQGFSSTRDKDGFCRPQGSWMHSMSVLGYKDGSRPGVAICNSWPSFLPGENEFGLPPSCFFCDASVFDNMCKMGDTFSLAGFNGFKPRADARVI
ncbi:MAG TPA: hypothetical protein PKX31_00210 [Chitinophagaceae bacterium]|nr:hypothetical protein [Chitinophagaceae bacterium]